MITNLWERVFPSVNVNRQKCLEVCFVNSETTYTDGDPVFVRMIATGNEVAGHVRNAADSTDCVLLKGARFWRSGSAGVAAINLDL